jgi:hypothetical protein
MEVIEAEDVAAIIADLHLNDLGQAEPMREVLLRHIDLFRGFFKAKDEEFVIKIPPQVEISRLDCPLPRRSELKRTADEAEVKRLLQLGILEPSTATASTEFVFVDKRTKDKDGNPERYTSTDIQKIDEVTEPGGYRRRWKASSTSWQIISSFRPSTSDTGIGRFRLRRSPRSLQRSSWCWA